VIGVNSQHHRNRQRFTIAHELGHHRLHPNDPTVYIDDLMVHFRGEDIHAPLTATELEANTFAASLLMPEDFIKRDFAGKKIDAQDEAAVRQLAHRYQVSVQALTIRLVELGMLIGTLGRPLKG
jgi:Zn-dependent peptidase ImmA (M78 family)